MSDEIFTISDGSNYLNSKENISYRQAASEEFPSSRMGHDWFFKKSEPKLWLPDQARRTGKKIRK